MSSTPLDQLELPTISIGRYLDLLRRRTWQVVSVSLLGLLVGGLVALLIPRYYVAHTIVQFNRPILDPKLGTPEDPMSQVVESSRVTVAGASRAWRGRRSLSSKRQRLMCGTRFVSPVAIAVNRSQPARSPTSRTGYS